MVLGTLCRQFNKLNILTGAHEVPKNTSTEELANLLKKMKINNSIFKLDYKLVENNLKVLEFDDGFDNFSSGPLGFLIKKNLLILSILLFTEWDIA